MNKKIFSILLGIVSISQVFGWQSNGVPICSDTCHQYTPVILPDGSGGAIIVWEDHRIGAITDIYAQRIGSNGNVMWQANGIPICQATSGQFAPVVASDDSGGAIIAWYDYRNTFPDIYAQRVNPDGLVKWSSDGVPVCTLSNTTQQYPKITSDGASGAIIVWEDKRNGNDNIDVYAQRINSNGATVWYANGIQLCNAWKNQTGPSIIRASSETFIIGWVDARTVYYADIYAQKINLLGDTLWHANGVMVYDTLGTVPQMVPDGSGGAIFMWLQGLSSADIYAQRLNWLGELQWNTEGVVICDTLYSQWNPVIMSDNANGAIMVWDDMRNGSNNNIYAQRIDSLGHCLWDTNGITICDAIYAQTKPKIVASGTQGAIITWQDERNVYCDIYAQRINFSGDCLWDSNGIAICNENMDQKSPQITTDGSGGSIIVWEDHRPSYTNCDIYAQNTDSIGPLIGKEEQSISDFGSRNANLKINKNPFIKSTVISYSIPLLTNTKLTIYDLSGRCVKTLVNELKPAGTYNLTLNATELKLKTGIYFLTLSAGTSKTTKKLILMK
ncbi:MAG: T9SS type A sorting domain-containing protein [bacterium]|nr:T9SS type A sorting domain-containing protein [bacterium]